MNVFDLAASLTLDKKNYEDGLNQAEGKAESSGNKIGNTFAKVGKVAVAGFAAVGTATATATTMFVKSTGQVAEYGDNIDKMSQKLGLSATAYQEWDAIMQHSGTSIDSMTGAMKVMSVQAEKGSDAFQKLGISQEEMANMNQEELFSKVIAGLQGMEEGTERTALATQLLGRGAVELGPLLNTSAEETEAMRQKVHELGGVMSDEGVKAAAKYQDTLQDMKTGFESLKRNLLADFMPSLTTVMDGLTDIFSGNYDEGLDKLSDGITKVVDEISSELPKIMEVGGKIIETLAMAIIDNLPTLIKAALPVIMELATGLIENLPKIVEAAIMLITTLAQGLVDALPKLIPAIVETITTIVEMLTEPDTLVQLIMAAVQIVIAIAEGLIQAIPILIKAVPQIISNLIEAIVRLFPLLLETGVQILTKIGEGIKHYIPKVVAVMPKIIVAMLKALGSGLLQLLAMGGKLIEALGKGLVGQIGHIGKAMAKVGKAIINGIKHLPKAMLNWGKDMIQGLIDGIKGMISKVGNAVKGVADKIKNFLHFSRPDEGPLREYEKWMPDMINGMSNSLKKASPSLINQAKALAQDMSDSLKIDGTVNAMSELHQIPEDFNPSGGSSRSTGGGSTYIINVNQPVSTPDEMANAIRVESQYGLIEGVPI